MKTTTLEKSLRKVQALPPPHLIIRARAGTGKTTTLVEGLKVMQGEDTLINNPSAQQLLIWQALSQSEDAADVCFVAFNKSIASELRSRLPWGREALTLHSLGLRALKQRFGNLNLDKDRVQKIVASILRKDIWELRKEKFQLLQAVEKLVGLCKLNLTLDCLDNDGVWVDEALTNLADYYDVDLNGHRNGVIALVPQVLEECKNVDKDIDFNDMIWLPVVLDDVHPHRYDVLLVDECQDLNRAQQELAALSGNRLIFCGDEKQAIYGFAGADNQSIDRLYKRLKATKQGCKTLHLTVTYRCGKAIVREAQKHVPDFEAHESCCEGIVSYQKMRFYRQQTTSGDMVLCRVNAPLVSECFKFLKEGQRADIQGRDIGRGLISTITKMKAQGIMQLVERLTEWLHLETQKEERKTLPSEGRLIALQDRYDCLMCFCENETTVQAVIQRIENIFSDEENGEGIKLSSIHRAKGLESDRVFLLQPEGATIPHPMSKSAQQIEQEYNCLYIAQTRSREELVYVS